MIRVPAEARLDILQVCKRLYERGLVAGTDGNVSIRISRDHLLATPTGMSKGFVTSDDLVICDMNGEQVSGTRRLTTEIKIHLAAYQQRDDVCAVVHAHPPYATAFAVTRTTMDERLMPEAYIAVGKVALTPYGTPSTDELEESIRPAVVDHDALLLSNHGAMTLGRDVMAAYHRMEALEQLARISAIARGIGDAASLTPDELARLEAIRGVYGSASDHDTPCYNCGWSPEVAKTADAGAAATAGRSALSQRDASRSSGGTAERGAASSPASPVVARATQAQPAGYTEPQVHWSGNPPVWEKPVAPRGRAGSISEAQVRDLARRTLQELRDQTG